MAENNVYSVVDEERMYAKAALRKYYKWRFGEHPPEGWQADHQVEQNMRFAEYFGTNYLHNIANLIFVPADVNADKNRRYQRTWKSAPKKYRGLDPLVLDIGPADAYGFEEVPVLNQAWVRDGLYQLILSMSDPEAFSFLFEFSKEMLMDIIRFKEKGIWKASPPQWLTDNPKWLDRLKDEVWYHSRYIGDYLTRFPEVRPYHPGGAKVQPVGVDVLARLFGYEALPPDYSHEALDF